MSSEATSIDEVLLQLTGIIEHSIETESRLGYFAALYRKVTQSVKDRINAGDTFDDNARMERLDVLFANRYIRAYHLWDEQDEGDPEATPSESWAIAFRATDDWWPIVLQHLLLGMNAHINLDLGIAAAETVSPAELPLLKADFDRINTLLASLVGDVTQELSWIWPPLRFITRSLGKFDDEMINFSMELARDEAWKLAETLSALSPSEREAEIRRQDAKTLVLGGAIRNPGSLASTALGMVRLCERGTTPEIIKILE